LIRRTIEPSKRSMFNAKAGDAGRDSAGRSYVVKKFPAKFIVKNRRSKI
jgi:hypothetical protein